MFDEEKPCGCLHPVKDHYGTPLNNCNVSGCGCTAFSDDAAGLVHMDRTPVRKEFKKRVKKRKK